MLQKTNLIAILFYFMHWIAAASTSFSMCRISFYISCTASIMIYTSCIRNFIDKEPVWLQIIWRQHFGSLLAILIYQRFLIIIGVDSLCHTDQLFCHMLYNRYVINVVFPKNFNPLQYPNDLLLEIRYQPHHQ